MGPFITLKSHSRRKLYMAVMAPQMEVGTIFEMLINQKWIIHHNRNQDEKHGGDQSLSKKKTRAHDRVLQKGMNGYSNIFFSLKSSKASLK